MRRILAVIAAAILMIVAAAGTAVAEGNGSNLGPKHRLQTFGYSYDNVTGDIAVDPSVTLAWTAGSDSPTDAQNNRALRVNVPAPVGDTSYFAEAYSTFALEIDDPVAQVRNLSFEFRNTEHVGGGAPRIIVIFGNGDVAYLAASGCNNPLGVSPTWSRADFTGRTTVGCAFPVTGETGGTYASSGTQSAWAVYSAAHPDQVVSYTDLVFDEPGTYSLDRITLGSGKMWNNANNKGVNCTTEPSC